MAIWAIADLHLSFGVPNKEMDIFGSQWINHPQKIEKAWREVVAADDLVLIPGDISWALKLADAKPDIDWIGNLPGTKVLLKGNHDFWWDSLSKTQSILPKSCHLIQNNSFNWKDVSIGGSRMWDTDEFNFDCLDDPNEVEIKVGNKNPTETDHSPDREKIFRRELGRLEVSLKTLNPNANLRIAMLHYPPIGVDLKDSIISKILEKYKINICVFGHLHNINPDLKLFGQHNGINYHLVACDHLRFYPLKIAN